MQTQEQDGKLILSYSPIVRVAIVGACVLLLFGWMAFKYSQGTLAFGEIIGISVGGIIFSLTGFFLYTPSTFIFDRDAQIVTWRKKNVRGFVDGQASFSDITDVKRIQYRDAETQGWQTLLIIGSKQVPLVDGFVQSEKQSANLEAQIKEFIGKSK